MHVLDHYPEPSPAVQLHLQCPAASDLQERLCFSLAHSCIAVQTMIIDYRLTFPSGTATGIMIKGFHTPLGQAIAKCVSVGSDILCHCNSFHKRLSIKSACMCSHMLFGRHVVSSKVSAGHGLG